MVTLLITCLLLIGLLAVAVYYWQKPTNQNIFTDRQMRPPASGSLFELDEKSWEKAEVSNGNSQSLLSRAANLEKTTLLEARLLGDETYDSVLTALVDHAGQNAQLVSLASYVARHDLPVNKSLAESFIQSWRESPDAASTATMLHLAALSNNAKIFQNAVELVLDYKRTGKLTKLSATDLQALLTGEFWVLSAGARNSGAGFLLKRTLSSARRELDANSN